MTNHNKEGALARVPEPKQFRFDQFGRAHHLHIDGVDEFPQIVALDEALWVASSAPTETLNAEAALLELLDNGDGRIRVREMKQALGWMYDNLSDMSGVRPGNEELILDHLRAESESGELLRRTSERILHRLGSDVRDRISLAQVREIKTQEEAGQLSEPGKVLVGSTDDAEVQSFISDVISCLGGVDHKSKEPAVDAALVDRFFVQAQERRAWLVAGEVEDVRPLGDETGAGLSLWEELRPQLAHYFALTDSVQITPALADQVWAPQDGGGPQVSSADELESYLRSSPIARPSAEGRLDLDSDLNPFWAARIKTLRQTVLEPLELGGRYLDGGALSKVDEALSPYLGWKRSEPQLEVVALGDPRILEALEAEDALRAAMDALFELSQTTSVAIGEIRDVERLLLYQGHMTTLLNSFVSFPDLYNPNSRALFEMGTLVMDGRRFTLAVRVLDRAKHARLSDASNMFVLYVEVAEDEGEALYEVAVPVTSGGRGNLEVGKRGVFHDIHGNELHARVVQIVDNPISLREACLQPFKRLGKALSDMIEKMKDQQVDSFESKGVSKVSSGVEVIKSSPETAPAPTPAPAAAAAPAPQAAATGGAGGLLAGGGIAIAALGSSLAFITRTIEDLGWQSLLTGIGLTLLAVMIPVVLVAWLKLRRRDLSSILEGSEWAINARMRLTRDQANTFTFTPRFPLGSRVQRGFGWWIVILLLVALIAFGLINHGWLLSTFYQP